MLTTLLRRGFDLVCTAAGLGVLFLLGPWMLFSGIAWRIPDAQQMVRLDGRVVGCRETFSAAVLVLEGYQTPFESQAGSCPTEVAQGGRSWQTSFFVLATASNGRPARVPIASYGLTMDGKVLRELQADLAAAEIDRTIRLCLGALGTLALICLTAVGLRHRGGLLRLVMGEERLSTQSRTAEY